MLGGCAELDEWGLIIKAAFISQRLGFPEFSTMKVLAVSRKGNSHSTP